MIFKKIIKKIEFVFVPMIRIIGTKWALVAVLIAGVLASRMLFRHNFYFNMHDDLQMMRQLQLEKCFLDLQIPCRWVPDMGYGFGFPLFNYYPQLPYLFGEVFRLFTLPFNDAAKLTFALGIIASGLSMYFLSKEFFGKIGGLLSAIFYIWAPYRAVDVYVRGAMNESWAWIWFPLILLFSYRLITNHQSRITKWLILLAISISALLLTHNLMALIFIPVAFVWAVFWIIKIRPKNLSLIAYRLSLALLLALGLSAFFTLPAVFEQKYVHIDTLTSDYFQYAGHFTTINQLFFSRFWGDGPSIFGPSDGLAFPIGQVHWVLSAILAIIIAVRIVKFRRVGTPEWIGIFGIVIGTAAAFLSHERSAPIWAALPFLKILQFPWRFLALNVFGYAFAIGAFAVLIPKKFVYLLICLFALLVIVFNWQFFSPVHSGALTDGMKFTGEAWRIQKQAGIRDYLPVGAKDDPESARDVLAEIFGVGTISNEKTGTFWASFDVEIPDDSIIKINIFDFPEWRVFVDENETEINIPDTEKWGRIHINVPAGKHSIYAKLTNTPLRTASNIISLASWFLLAGYLIWRRKNK